MNKKLLLASSIGALAATLLAAEVTVYEGFDYSGADLGFGSDGGTGWSGSWTQTGGGPHVVLQYETNSLSNGAYVGTGLTAVGGALGNDHNSAGSKRDFSTGLDLDVNADYYFSYLMSFPNTGSQSVNFVGSSAGAAFFARFTNGSMASTAGGGTFSTAGSEAYATDTTYFVVGKIAASASGNDVMSLNVFDTSEVVPLTESFLISSAGSAVTGTISGIEIYQGDSSGNNNGSPLLFDEFRVGTTWSSVAVPEPSSYALLAGALALGVIAVRRRRS